MSVLSFGRALALAIAAPALLVAAASCSGAPTARTAAAASPAAAPPEPSPPPAAESAAAEAPEAAATTAPPIGEQAPTAAADNAASDEPTDLPEEGGDEADEPEAPEGPAGNSTAVLHEALDAYESAEVFWQHGNFDDAFAALDRAYELMAGVAANGDPAASQEKDDLRRLISRRLVEIYASRQTAVGDPDRGIPVVVNDDVQREIASFQGPERAFFLESYRRSGLYRPMILGQIHAAGLPEQLSWLPLVESGFSARAFSRSRALGLWQFISSTGYRYDLHRTRWVDERMDPEASTRAALAYLTDLHGLFGDWLTALAAYNCGEQTVLREIHRQPVAYFDRFWDLYQLLPRETRRYVPRFLAVLAILGDPARYGFELPEPLANPATETVTVERPVQLKRLDVTLGLDGGTLERLNPQLRRGATPADPFPLRVPAGLAATVSERLPKVPEWTPPALAFSVHRVRRGETLSGLAARYRTSVRAIMQANHLRSANRIWPGQRLEIPDRRDRSRTSTVTLAAGAEVRHRVVSGDSLWSLAQRYGTTVDRIRSDNGLTGDRLNPGQVLRIRGTGGPATGGYIVQTGDTLAAIARDHGVPLRRLLEENHLTPRSTIYPGQTIQIPD